MAKYEVFPFDASPERAAIVSDFMRRVAATESVFSEALCATGCVSVAHLHEMCPACLSRMHRVAAMLAAPDSRAWEVWNLEGDATPVGLVLLTQVVPGHDAIAHYVFFDERLGDKSATLNGLIAWCFEDHPDEGWAALARLTIEIPTPFAALARHAAKRLGFGGDFPYVLHAGERPIRVEGVRRKAALWKGALHDVLVLARLRSVGSQTSQEAAQKTA